MVILAQDPSFRALSYSLYDGVDTIYMGSSGVALGQSIGFDRVYSASLELFTMYRDQLEACGVGDSLSIDVVFSEIPPPIGSFSAGLYALDTYTLSRLWSEYASIQETWVIPPSYLGTVHGTSKYKKGDSTRLAKYFISEVLGDRFKIVIPDSVSASGRVSRGQVNNDRAESFLFLMRAFCKYDIMGLRDALVSEYKGLGFETEKLLCSRVKSTKEKG